MLNLSPPPLKSCFRSVVALQKVFLELEDELG